MEGGREGERIETDRGKVKKMEEWGEETREKLNKRSLLPKCRTKLKI